MTMTFRAITLWLITLFYVGAGSCQMTAQQRAPKPKDRNNFAPFIEVIKVVEGVLDQVQDHLKTVGSPPLQQAELDFQTVTTNDVAGGLIISIVTAEGEHVRATTREIDFIYSVAPQPVNKQELRNFSLNDLIGNLRKTSKPDDFNKTLPAAIVAAADSMNAVRSIVGGGASLTQRQFVITISFSVTKSFNVGIDPSALIVVAPTLKYTRSKQSVQTVKLTFC